MVESRIYPFARFSACIEKLDEAMIEVLKDSMLRMECPLPMLKNNYQTCIFMRWMLYFKRMAFIPNR